MDPKLAFVYVPVPAIEAVLPFYRDTLGLTEAWREGDTTVALVVPGTDVQLMLDAPGDKAGPVLILDSVHAYVEQLGDSANGVKPVEIPGGYWAVMQDPAGNPVYLMDQSKDPAPPVG
jgi:catechol 2,3-dioxygenase-like lactoylglutathione lyase family enzyme